MLNLIKSSQKIEKILRDFLNSKSREELDLNESVRAVGDKIPSVIGEKIKRAFGSYIIDFKILDSSKKISNIIVQDKFLNNYFIDIITHNINKVFARPNITTVKTIEKLYSNPKNIFLILLVHYNPDQQNNFITEVQLFPIEWLDWDSLDIGALGNGQIQIKDSGNVVINKNAKRDNWNREFQNRLITFYKKQQAKISKRISQLMEVSLF
jgi:hypothetical protein